MEEALRGGPSMAASFTNFLDSSLQFRASDSLAPRFHHDQLERSVQMRLYSLGRQGLTLVFSFAAAFLAVALFLGLAGPPITATLRHSYAATPGWNETKSSSFSLKSPHLSAYAQQLWLIGEVVTGQKEGLSFEQSIITDAVIRGQDEAGTTRETLDTLNRTQRLKCFGPVCNQLILFHLGVVRQHHYAIELTMRGLDEVKSKFGVNDVVFYFKSYNPAFTKLELYARFAFVLVVFAFSVWYFQSLSAFPLHYWALEQRWLAALLPLLLLYDNPLFPLIILWDGWAGRAADSVFQATFLATLLLFWLCAYHGLRQSSRPFTTFYAPKLALVGPLWFLAVCVAVWDRANQLADPGWYSNSPTASFISLKGLFLVLGLVYVAALLFLLVRAYAELRSLPHFDLRLNVATWLMLVVMSVVVGLSFSKWGLLAGLEDSLVGSLRTHYASSGAFMLAYSVLNLYVCVLAFLYSPNPNISPHLYAQNGLQNAALLNDESEDELVFAASDFVSGEAPDDDDDY